MRYGDTTEQALGQMREDIMARQAAFHRPEADHTTARAKAQRALVRGKDGAIELASRVGRTARERPMVVAAVAAGVVGLILLARRIKTRGVADAHC